MPLVTRNPVIPSPKPTEQNNVLNQIDAICHSTPVAKTDEKAKARRKEKNADTINVVLPRGERSVFKSFCAAHNISMTEYIYTCMDFIKWQVEQGKMEVGRSGIKTLEPR